MIKHISEPDDFPFSPVIFLKLMFILLSNVKYK